MRTGPVPMLQRLPGITQVPGLAPVHEPGQTSIRFHPMEDVRAFAAQDVQQAERQHRLPVGSALATCNALKQFAKRAVARRGSEQLHHAAVWRHVGFGVLELHHVWCIGTRQHLCTWLVKILLFRFPSIYLIENSKSLIHPPLIQEGGKAPHCPRHKRRSRSESTLPGRRP